MVDKMFEGTVDLWIDRGTAAGYGFLTYEQGASRRIGSLYFDYHSLMPNNIGLRSHGKIVGNLVRFRMDRHVHRGEKKAIARDVQSVFATDVENPDDHREISVVDHIVPGSRSRVAAVFLRRSSGDQLFLSQANVIDEHKNRFDMLRIGDHVWHGVRPPDDGKPTWLATGAELYSPEEELQFSNRRS